MSNAKKIKKGKYGKDRIIKYPDESLFIGSEMVVDFDQEKLAKLAKKLMRVNYAVKGLAVAAPQVGEHLQVFYYLVHGDGEGLMINPKIVDFSDHSETMPEGCLSIPGWYWNVTRPAAVKVKWNDHYGSEFEATADGLLGRIIQHEIDHFNGILLPDYFDDETFEQFVSAFFDGNQVSDKPLPIIDVRP